MKWTLLALVACVAAQFDMERDLVPTRPARVVRAPRTQTIGDCKTNAECIRKRLPLLPPKPKRVGPLLPRQSPCVPQLFKGYLRAHNASNNAFIGYVGSRQGLQGYFGSVASDVSSALGIQFDACANTALSSVDIMIRENQRTMDGGYYPLFGVAASWENGVTPDIGPGDTLLYLGGMEQSTGRGAQPNSKIRGTWSKFKERDGGGQWYAESTVWNFDPVTMAISATWINYGGGAYTGSWAYNPRITTTRGWNIAVTSNNLPAGPWSPVVSTDRLR